MQKSRTPSKAAFAPPGYLLFARGGTERPNDGTLMAQRFDPERLELEGDPFTVVDNVGISTAGNAGFTASENGILALRSTRSGPVRLTRLTWFDRNGKPLGTLGEPAQYGSPRLSPDGTRVVVEIRDKSGQADLFLLDPRGVPTQFTFDSGYDIGAVWSPDGNRIAWTNRPDARGGATLYQKASSNIEKEEKLPLEAGNWEIDDWVRLAGGDALLFHDGGSSPTSRPVFRLLPLAGGGGAQVIGDARAPVAHVRVSPDGHWVAFTSRDSGRAEIYVQDFPKATGLWRVSTAGGAQPVWQRPDGKELFYVAGGTLMAHPLKLTQTVEPGIPVPLFETHLVGGPSREYDVTPDGKRFLVNTPVDPEPGAAPPAPEPITVIVNWTAGLRK